MGDDVLFCDDPCGLHSERTEDTVAQQITVKLSGRLADGCPEHDIPGVAVIPSSAWREFQLQAVRKPHQLVFGVVATVVDRPPGVIRKSGGMRQQVPHGDGAPVRRRVGKVFRQRIVERQFPVLHEQHHQRGGELLADRA